MATPLPLPDSISPETTRSFDFRVIMSNFGDGYVQSAPDGLNAQRDKWTVIWKNVNETDKTTITTALNTVGSWGVITWTPFDETVQKKFRMDSPGYSIQYTLSAPGHRRYIITCNLTQCFDL
jgi:phage-related protein